MVRQRQRKTVEELYGAKFDTTPIKAHAPISSKTERNNRDFGAYIISSNTPYNPTTNNNTTSSHLTTNRTARKSARLPHKSQESFYPTPDEKHINLDNRKKDIAKPKSARGKKPTSVNAYPQCGYSETIKAFGGFTENITKEPENRSHGQHTHMHNHSHVNTNLMQEDEKDDDTEEFFELIRQTVESAIGKSITEILNRNFRELSAKIDRFASDLKSTNNLLNKLQNEVNNKVVHYGEENSRHFRYLCMKSEYDKMFYQHHTMLASKGTSSPMEKRRKSPQTKNSDKIPQTPQTPCNCRSTKTSPRDIRKVASEEHDISAKSSEPEMRQLLKYFQRVYTQMQDSDGKVIDEHIPNKNNFRLDDSMNLDKQELDEDDEYPLSSDGMTPRSEEGITKYSGRIKRGVISSRGATGGGDA